MGVELTNGSIENSYATGDVSVGNGVGALHGGGVAFAGGLVGRQAANVSIANSYATGEITGGTGSSDGGLAGRGGSISNSYATGDVAVGNSSNAGGFVGVEGRKVRGFSGVVSSYSTGRTTSSGTSVIGGFAGDFSQGSCTDCYWDMTTSGIGKHHGAGNLPNAPGMKGKTTAQLRTALLPGFTSSVWGLDPGTNEGFPFLKKLNDSY